MKNVLRLALVIAIVALVGLSVAPPSARGVAGADLQLSAAGSSGVVVSKAGCTRITNRFCVQSDKSNCFACH